MGSRTLPVECEHGKVMDWGDFGPDDGDPEFCSECDSGTAPALEAENLKLRELLREARPSVAKCRDRGLVRPGVLYLIDKALGDSRG